MLNFKAILLTMLNRIQSILNTWYNFSTYIYVKYLIMKNFIALFVCVLLVGNLFSQEEITVQLKEKKFYDSEAIAFIVEIPQAEYKSVLKAWTKYLKNNLKEKVIVENGEVSILKKFLPKIANDSIDIHSYVKEYAGHIVLAASFKLKGQYISKQSTEEVFYPTKNYVRNFAIEQYKKAVKKELKEEQKKYDKFDYDLKLLLKANDVLQDANKQAKRDILKNKDLITLNEMDQSSKVLQIQSQKELIYKLVNSVGNEQKDAKKILKQIELDFKKLQNKKSILFNKIDVLESKIRLNNRNIEENEKQQRFLKLDKDDQEYIVKKIEKKLGRIK